MVDVAKEGTICEYWISPTFQSCLHITGHSHSSRNIFLVDGKYYSRGEKGLPIISCCPTIDRLAFAPLSGSRAAALLLGGVVFACLCMIHLQRTPCHILHG